MKTATMMKCAVGLCVSMGTIGLAAPPGDTPNKPANSTKLPGRDARLFRASELIGMNVNGSANDTIGEIKDIAIDPRCACARFAVLSSGGVMGVGDTLAIVPLKALRIDHQNKTASLNIDKTRLEQAPKFTDEDWGRLTDKNWTTTVYQYYKVEPDGDVELEQKEVVGAQSPRILKGSDVVGMDVHSGADEDLGELEDVMIDLNSGRIGYAVLSFGGVLGVNEKLFAVPWQTLKTDAEADKLVLNVDTDKLANAPGFDENDWPDMSELNWSKDVHAFYGSDPNWIYGYTDEGQNQNKAQSEKSGKNGWGADSEYNRKFNAGAVQTFRGTITDMGSSEPMDGMSEAATITLRNDQGEDVVVHLGPEWFIDNQEHQFKENEQVEVTGSRIDMDGKPVILAVEVKRGSDTLRLRDRNGRPFWAAWHSQNSDRQR
jgi:sporulation protein YlmC with PRC-barrel domain